MNKVEIIPNGAALICNDVIESVGPAPRIENLAGARKAVELNAAGKIIMPAFVELDGAVLHDGSEEFSGMPHNFRTSSRRKLSWAGVAHSAEYARYGTLSSGITSLFGEDLRTALKLLQTLQGLQGRPLRIRPIVSACPTGAEADHYSPRKIEQFVDTWLPAIKGRKLASIVEIEAPRENDDRSIDAIRTLALAAANLQFAIRIRAQRDPSPAVLELAAAAGATALLSPPRPGLLGAASLLRSNTIVALPSEINPGTEPDSGNIRPLIESGAAIALCMGSATGNDFTRNMQHALYIACRHFKMTPEEAITATTINAAYSLRTAHTTGSLEPGKCADLLVMDVPDYRELVRRPGMSNLEMAMRAGHVVYRRPPLILD